MLKTKKPCRADRAFSCSGLNLDWYDAYCFALRRAFRAEIYRAGNLGEQGMILAHANIVARMDLRAALTNNDTAGRDQLAAVAFYTQAFGI